MARMGDTGDTDGRRHLTGTRKKEVYKLEVEEDEL